MTPSRNSECCDRCGGPRKILATTRGSRHVCASQCGRWSDRKTDDQVRTIVAEMWTGTRWRDIIATHKIDPPTLRARAEQLGLAIPEGRRKTIKPMRLAVPEEPAALAYLAGIIDGEGSITLRLRATPRAYVFIAVTNTSPELRAWLKPIGGSFFDRKQDGRLGHKPIFNWNVRGRLDCLALLRAIEPYMVIKRSKAQAAIALLEEWDVVPAAAPPA